MLYQLVQSICTKIESVPCKERPWALAEQITAHAPDAIHVRPKLRKRIDGMSTFLQTLATLPPELAEAAFAEVVANPRRIFQEPPSAETSARKSSRTNGGHWASDNDSDDLMNREMNHSTEDRSISIPG